MKKITFVLPGVPVRPSGGTRIVFKYASLLVKKGYEVTICFMCKNDFCNYHFPERIREMLVSLLVRLYPAKTDLDDRVKKIPVFSIDDKSIPDADYVFATAAITANAVYSLSRSKGKKNYLIQGYETWAIGEEELFATYSKMKNIVVAKWLKKIVDKYSEVPSVLISNPIDTTVFHITKDPKVRYPKSVAALYHTREIKGFKYTWEAIKELKKRNPDLIVNIFGMPKRPDFFPKWVNYTQNATHTQVRDIYNNSAIFICGTIEEGFGLTGAEAMACGCALVSTDYDGVREYAIDKINALLSPIRNAVALVENVETLFENSEMKLSLINNGVKLLKNHTWDYAICTLEKEVLHDE